MSPDANQVPIWRRYARLFGPDAAADVKDELAFHLEAKTDELIAQGLTPEAARTEALRQFGELHTIQHIGEQMGGKMERRKRFKDYWDDLRQDVRYTLRTLRRDAGFTTVAILILALAIGANIAVFSVVNTILLRPLPFPNAQELVWIAPPPQKCGMSCATYSTDAYDEFRMYTRSFQDVTGYFAFSSAGNLSLTRGSAPIPATGIDVIHNFFSLLGVRPEMGRLFTAADAQNGAAPVILLTDSWWRTQFGADPNIVGKAFDINGQQTTVIGVLPKSFDFGAVFSPGAKIDAFTPLNLYGPPRNWGNIITFIGRMKPGVTLAQARGDATAAAPHMCWNNKQPQTCGGYAKDGVVPVALKEYVSGKMRRSLIVLWSAVGAILLIACVNLSNLLLARSAARSKEFAMRGALGATRARIVRQLLTESLLLSMTGAVFGLLLAAVLLAWMAHQGAIALPLLSSVRVDGQVLGWTVLIAVAAALLFGIMPGLRMASGNLTEALKDSGAGSGQGRKHERVRSVLVVTEVALACMLLVGAGLLLRSFLKVLDVDLGFEPTRAAAMRVDYNDNAPTGKESALKRRGIFQQVIARVSQIPGVEAAGISDYLPLGQNRAWGTPTPKGKNYDNLNVPAPLVYVITPGYQRAMGARLRGRDFTWDDGPDSPPVVMINESFAKYFWPNEDAVGKMLTGGGQGADLLIVGVVSDAHEETTEAATGWQIYYPTLQAAPSKAELVVRSKMPPALLAGSVLTALRELNPKQTAAEFVPIQTLVDHANSPRRFFMLLVGAFAVLGLLLAALGIYGVISYSVTRQTQEIGIRMALGSSTGRVERLVLGSTLRLALIGVVLGVGASLIAARLIASLLFGLTPSDVATYGATAAVLLAVALFAGYLPARRAARIDPMVALRSN